MEQEGDWPIGLRRRLLSPRATGSIVETAWNPSLLSGLARRKIPVVSVQIADEKALIVEETADELAARDMHYVHFRARCAVWTFNWRAGEVILRNWKILDHSCTPHQNIDEIFVHSYNLHYAA